MTPLTPERLKEIEHILAELRAGGENGIYCRTVADLLAERAYWVKAVRGINKTPRCPFACDESVSVDVFWNTPERHKPDCPWVAANRGEE